MTVAYFDASALVKLFIDESGSGDVATLWNDADLMFASRVVDTEVHAALAAAHRARRLNEVSYRAAKHDWGRYRPVLRIVELTPALGRTAADLSEAHALAALDAIHLASAIRVVDEQAIVATWDVRMLAAARSLGMATMPAATADDR